MGPFQPVLAGGVRHHSFQCRHRLRQWGNQRTAFDPERSLFPPLGVPGRTSWPLDPANRYLGILGLRRALELHDYRAVDVERLDLSNGIEVELIRIRSCLQPRTSLIFFFLGLSDIVFIHNATWFNCLPCVCCSNYRLPRRNHDFSSRWVRTCRRHMIVAVISLSKALDHSIWPSTARISTERNESTHIEQDGNEHAWTHAG